MIPIISVIAYSGTGKTTFLEKLIPELKKNGLRVAVVKHDAHEFEIDKEGKDSYRITKAGASVTGLVSASKSVIMENRPSAVEEVFDKITDVDLILTEGFKTGNWAKIMLHRQATGKDLPIPAEDCIAVVSDVPVVGAKEQFDLNDAASVAEFIVHYLKKRYVGKSKNMLYKVPFLQDLNPSTLEGLWKDGSVEEFKKGTILLSAREMSEIVFIQLTGKSAIYNLTLSGDRKVIFIFGKGILLNDHVMTNHAPSVYCETIEKSKIFVISKKAFIKWMGKDFDLTTAVLNMQEWKMWRMGHQLKNTNGSIYMERKLAAKLWKLARDFGEEKENGVEINFNLSITFLSDMLGCPRETTSRICRVFQDQGLITINRKRITILDPDRLAALYKISHKKKIF
ncbi:MAG: molybdopterin-guanine dinucleotide biosynthesis protein B [Eubacteriales bacterium]|nr:molybdopterin-guanine dinucleotide biosynthesis protein B [Eubacteriales bacterium]